jgi:thiamine biosynthesis lipoprotein
LSAEAVPVKPKILRGRPILLCRSCAKGWGFKLLLLLLINTVLLGVGWIAEAQPAPQLFTITHPAMGTVFTLYIYAADREEADAKANPVFDEIDGMDDLLSNYKESSELSRINRLAATQPVTTDPETFEFLSDSLKWSALSNGAFDITVGKLMKAWGFFLKQGHIPTEAEFVKLQYETGWQKVKLDAAKRTVRFTSPGVELDPGGIGKGFAVDKAVAILRSEQVSAAMLSAGSSTIYALGAPPGKAGWKIEVPDPLNPQIVLSTVTLRNTSLSSANCSEKHFILNGHLYCHIMDPKTLHPVEGMLQVTVIDASATNSDALSNVLFVRKPEENVPLMKSLPDDSALVITGTQQKATCHLMNWKAPIAPGLC